jgi:L-threonylcarbamoyladenylate synthase
VTCDIAAAARCIRAGGLAAFPTETVYGLGADALNARAVERIFEVKGRPRTSPLIVHVDSVAMARGLAREWPPEAEELARRYWPGPLTLVVRKDARIPDAVTAGLDTVGLRMPAHPVALELIRLAGVPVAAPSANRFTELSPTTAEHVRRSLGNDVDCILDGGPAAVGIESVVLSLAEKPAVLYRPGVISAAELEEVAGPIRLAAGAAAGPHASPGLHPGHYRPSTPLYMGEGPREGRGFRLFLTGAPQGVPGLRMPADARGYAAVLYATLHGLDRQGFDWIAVEMPPDTPAWAGVLDRLRRAAI